MKKSILEHVVNSDNFPVCDICGSSLFEYSISEVQTEKSEARKYKVSAAFACGASYVLPSNSKGKWLAYAPDPCGNLMREFSKLKEEIRNRSSSS